MPVTPFDEFRKRKARQHAEARDRSDSVRQDAAEAAYADLLVHLDETARLIRLLETGADRDLAGAVARAGVADREALRRLALGYERLSWRLCGQLRAVLDRTRKG